MNSDSSNSNSDRPTDDLLQEDIEFICKIKFCSTTTRFVETFINEHFEKVEKIERIMNVTNVCVCFLCPARLRQFSIKCRRCEEIHYIICPFLSKPEEPEFLKPFYCKTCKAYIADLEEILDLLRDTMA